MKTRYIEGRQVHYASTISANVGEYTIYRNKIWRVVASYSSGFRTLERSKTNEMVTVGRNVELLLIFKPTGHIDI